MAFTHPKKQAVEVWKVQLQEPPPSTLSLAPNEPENEPSTTCEICKLIAKNVEKWDEFQRSTKKARIPVASLQQLMENGVNCRTCLLLYSIIVKRATSIPVEYIDSHPFASVAIGALEGTLLFEILEGSPPNLFDHFSVVPPSGLMTGARHRIPTDPRSFDIGRLKHWIAECDSQHGQTCNIEANVHQAPAELLFIDVQNYCLTKTDTRSRYLALSYVWGDSSGDLRALKSNIHTLCRANSLLDHWNQLPATIKDMIHLAGRLDIPYVWIDRLCIVQDDEQFIHHSIASMALIYTMSYLTIVAADGPDAHAGIRGIGSMSGPRAGDDLTLAFNGLQFGYLKPEFPTVWHSRGWTYQERVVSNRCLVFYDGTLKWECRKGVQFEGCTGTVKDSRTGVGYHIEHRKWPDFQQYSAYCVEYSKKRLTYPEDALKAFSAIVDCFDPSFPGGFFWAMPEFAFDIALLWSNGRHGTRRKQFPSWSWLAWDGTVTFPGWNPLKGVEDQTQRDQIYEPMGKWMKQSAEEEELLEINNEYHLWQNDVLVTSRQTHYDNKWRAFVHPNPRTVPRPKISVGVTLSPFLHCFANVGHFILGRQFKASAANVAAINDCNGHQVGFLQSAFEHDRIIEGSSCMLMAICASYDVHRYGSDEILARSEASPSVKVLWIDCQGDIAYRMGCGQVIHSAWKKANSKKMKIVLG